MFPQKNEFIVIGEEKRDFNILKDIIEEIRFENTFFIHFSSTKVYNDVGVLKEEAEVDPFCILVKMEEFVQHNWKNSLILRISKVYGPKVNTKTTFFQQLEEKLSSNKPFHVEDKKGDFIFARDLLEVVDSLAGSFRSKIPVFGVMNVSGEVASEIDFCREICKAKNLDFEQLVVCKQSVPKNFVLDCSKLNSFMKKKWAGLDKNVRKMLYVVDVDFYLLNSPKTVVEKYMRENGIEGTLLFACRSSYGVWNVEKKGDMPSFYGVIAFPTFFWMKVRRPKPRDRTFKNYERGEEYEGGVVIEIDEIWKVCEELVKGGPQAIEYLYVEEQIGCSVSYTVYEHPFWKKLKEIRKTFLTDFSRKQFFGTMLILGTY